MKKILIPILVPLWGCVQVETHYTEVLSEPPGARIEVDQDYIGEAPIKITWEGAAFAGRRFSGKDHVVRAIPVEKGHFVQEKRFAGGQGLAEAGDMIPRRIFFDMRLAQERVAPQLQIVVDPIKVEIEERTRLEPPQPKGDERQ